MARRCSVCIHPNRQVLDRELARGDGNTVVARRYGLSVSMVKYHKERHLLYLLDPALGLGPMDLLGIQTIVVTTRRTVRKGS